MSRIAQPGGGGKTDQRKVYTDWANNRLKKAGLSNVQVTDLQKEIPDGYILPKIIQAVVHEEVPGILSSPDNNYEKKQNVEASVMFLQRIGINCNGFSAKDISDGSMKAILQLFFSLSQFKPKAATAEEPHPQQPVSRLRPVSPGLRMVHSVKPTEGSGSKLRVPASNGLSLPNSLATTPSTSQSSSTNNSPVGTPVSNPPHSLFSSSLSSSSTQNPKSQAALAAARRHAGSTIPTGMDPLGMIRRVPYRALNIAGGPDTGERTHKLSSSGASSPVPSPPEQAEKHLPPEATPTISTSVPRSTGLQAPKTSSSSLRSPGSFSFKSNTSIGSDSALTSSSESFRSEDDSSSQSSAAITTVGGGSMRLNRSNSSITESSSPGLRKKFSMPSGGRSTPTIGFEEKSGLVRPTATRLKAPAGKTEAKTEDKTPPPAGEEKPVMKKRSNTLDSSSLTKTAAEKEGTPPTADASTTKATSAEVKRPSVGSGLQKLTRPHTVDSKTKEQQLAKEETPETQLVKSAGSASKLQRLTQLPPASKLKGGPTIVQSEPSPPKDTEEKESESSSSEPNVSRLALLTRKPPLQKPTQLRKGGPSLLSTLTSKETPREPSPNTEKAPLPSDPIKSNVPLPPEKTSPTKEPIKSQAAPPVKQIQAPPTTKDSPKKEPTKPPAHALPPLNIKPDATPTKPLPATSDPRSSSSSINSNNSTHSETSITDMQTPSPFSVRKCIRRTSPEGMSVDETASPRDNRLSDGSHESELEKSKEVFSPNKENDPQMVVPPTSPKTGNVKRAQSLSPKASRRIFPLPSHLSDHALVAPVSDENLSSGQQQKQQPKRSALRASRQSSDVVRSDKHVKISPNSSVESFSSSDVSLSHNVISPLARVPEQKRKTSQNERPKSMEDLESHAFTVSGFPGDLQTNLVRRGSTRSERLDYSDVESFLETGLQDRTGSSTPELLETYENQLTNLKKDLESKVRMLTMYENSMADLSTKVTSLKRTLEQKDKAIKHLTEERHRWQDAPFDTHSLAPSRLAVPADPGTLSDGGYSDGGQEIEKDPSPTNKKKDKEKKWKRFSLRQKRNRVKKEQEINQMEVASLAGSVAAGNGRSLKRTGTIGGGGGSNRKPSDLISISEYSAVDTRTVRDFDTKSLGSEYGAYMGMPIMEDLLTIYEEGGEGVKVTVELLMNDEQAAHVDSVETLPLGTVTVPEDCSWVMMDTKICDIFLHHINAIDPEQSLNLTDDSILHYMVDNVKRSIGNALLPFATPHQVASNDSHLTLALKGVSQESCDALAYKYLVNVDVLHDYISLLLETQWIVVMGTKGTCKTSIAEGLVSYLELFVEEEAEEEEEFVIDDSEKKIVRKFSISSAPGSVGGGLEAALKFMKEELSRQIYKSTTPILLFDNIYDCNSLEQLLGVAGTLPKRPYIVATLCSGSTRGIPLHQLMFRHNIRVVTCSPQTEPILGILSRTLRKRVYQLKADPNVEVEPVAEQLLIWLPYLLDHLNYFINKFHSNNVALGPRVFLNCPLDTSASDMEVWFINLWNHFIIPYLMGTIMAGIETYSADPHLDWIDVREWVIETYPWPSSVNVSKLKTLTPEDVGWNHAVRPQNQSRFMSYMRDEDTQSVLRMQS